MVNDVTKTVEYYVTILGFEVVMSVPVRKAELEDKMKNYDLEWSMVKKGDVEIFFHRQESFYQEIPFLKNTPMGGAFNLYITIEDAKGFYNQIKAKVETIKEPYETFYGAIAFSIRDINGLFLYFAEHKNINNFKIFTDYILPITPFGIKRRNLFE